MADLARALQTPVPATQPAPQQPTPLRHDGSAGDVKPNVKTVKNERARLRRKAKRAADLKAAHLKAVEAALTKKKKRKAKKKAAAAPAPARKKARGRGRPPGSKNKPKLGLAVALVPDPIMPRATIVPRSTDPFSVFLTVRDMMRALLPAQRVQVLAALVNNNK